MDKKGRIPQILVPVIVVLGILGLIGVFEEDVPDLIEALKDDICIEAKKGMLDICFVNETGIRINGKADDLTVVLQFENSSSECILGSGTFKAEQVCEHEFGLLYERPLFELKLFEKKTMIKSIRKVEIYSLFSRAARNPKLVSKSLLRSNEAALVLRGIIYLQDHPELFNSTSNNN